MRDTARLSHESRSVSLNLAIPYLILKILKGSRCPFWYSLRNSRQTTWPMPCSASCRFTASLFS